MDNIQLNQKVNNNTPEFTSTENTIFTYKSKNRASRILKKSHGLIFCGMALLTNSLTVNAANLGAHVHGVSALAIAIENEQVDIEFSSPAANILGFEHQAETIEELEMVKAAQLLLASYSDLFVFSGAECKYLKHNVDMSDLIPNLMPDQHKKSHNDVHKHDTSHSHSHSDENAEINSSSKSENHKKHGVHSEVVANYQFSCEKMHNLSAITVEIFTLFSGVEQIDAMWVSPTGQNATTLNLNNNTIRL